MAFPAGAELTVAMCRNSEAEGDGSQMGHFAKKVYRRFSITVFQFSVCRTHSAGAADPASQALRNLLALALGDLEQKLLPAVTDAAAANVICLLMREYADTHVPVRIDRESAHSSAARVHVVSDDWRRLQFAGESASVFCRYCRPVQVECDDLFWRKPYIERRRRAIDPGIDHGIEFEFDPEFVLREFLHAGDFVPVDADRNGLQLE